METVDKTILGHRFNQLMEVTIQMISSNEYTSTEISFSSGPWYQEEGYKKRVWDAANNILKYEEWKSPTDQTIIKKTIDTMAMAEVDQNLVSIPSINKVIDIFYSKPEKTAEILYNLYKTDNDEMSFMQLSALLGNKLYDPFSVVAYLFFIKDRDKYIPLRKDGFMERLPKLNLPVKYMLKCSWENYSVLLDIMRQLQGFLQEHLQETVELLDAQSFFWMLWRVTDSTPEYDYEEQDENETIVSEGYKEGRVTKYYVKKYERDPRNRREAIRIHKCKCMACGFDFQKVYGELGKNFIEVHHVVPLSSRDEIIEINPATDLVCLCSNCHRMVHRKKNAIVTIEELKTVLEKAKES